MNAIKAAVAAGNADPVLLDEARKLHREAQFGWDIVSAENSTGFHNPEYALKTLADATNRARRSANARRSIGRRHLFAGN